MALGNFSGIKLLEYDTAGNAFAAAVSLGIPLADSPGIADDPQEVETGKGNTLYAGIKREHVFNISDLSKFAALETIMEADTEIDVRVTDLDDATETIALEATAKVKKMLGSAVGTRNYFEVKFQNFKTT